MKALRNPWVLLLVALAARLLMIAFGPMPANDDGAYEKAILNYFDGHGLTYVHDIPLEHNRLHSWLPPGWPAIVIVYYKLFGVGADQFFLRLLITLTGAGACVWLFFIGQRLKMENLGLIAGYMLALYPPQALDSTALNPHAVANNLFVGALLLVIKGFQDQSFWCFPVSGLLWGGIVLNRGEWLACFGLCGLWILLDPRLEIKKRILAGALLGLGWAAVMTPWVARNWNIHHRFVLLSTNYADNFYFSHNPAYKFTGDAVFYNMPYLRELCTGLGEVDCAKVVYNEGWRYALEDKPRFIRTTLGNAWQFWRPYLSLQKYSVFQSAAYAVMWLPVFFLFLVGLFVVPWRREPLWILFASFIALKCTGHLFFYVIVRFREALAPMFILFAAAALLHFYEKRRLAR